jgi:hypothetical protein
MGQGLGGRILELPKPPVEGEASEHSLMLNRLGKKSFGWYLG